MPRALLWTALTLLIVSPTVAFHRLGNIAIDRLEAEDRRQRVARAEQELLAALTREVRRDARWLPLTDTASCAVRLEPDGAYLASSALLAARALATQQPVLALEVLGPLLRADDAGAAIASLAAAAILDAVGRGEPAESLRRRALAIVQRDEWSGSTLAREVALEAAVAGDSASVDAALEAWVVEVEGRGTDLEELVLLAHLAERASSHAVRARIDERRRLPRVQADVAARVRGADPRLRLVATQAGWFAIDPPALRFRSGPDPARVVPALEQAPQRDPRPVEITGVLAGDDLVLELGDARLALVLPSAALFAVDPRWLLRLGMLGYGLIAGLLLFSIQRQMRRADRLVAARDDLIAQVGHELRTPLTVLRMYGESLLAGRVREGVRDEYLRGIVVESQRIGDLVDRVTRAARDEEVAVTGELRADLAAVVTDVAASFRERISEAQGTLSIEVQVAVPAVRAAADDLRLVCDVLLDNAVRYGGAGPRIEIAVAVSGAVACVAVRDHGPGVSAAERGLVFERWQRGEQGRKQAGRGAGMGLFLARRIARAHGGDLLVEAPPGGGARFVWILPLAGDGVEA